MTQSEVQEQSIICARIGNCAALGSNVSLPDEVVNAGVYGCIEKSALMAQIRAFQRLGLSVQWREYWAENSLLCV